MATDTSVLMRGHGGLPHGALVAPKIQPPPTKIVRFAQSSFATFRVVELDIVQPTFNKMQFLYGHGASAHGAPMAPGYSLESTSTLRFSDTGFVSDDGTPYPPFVASAFSINRGLTLTADALGGALSAGSISLNNVGGPLNELLQNNINDHLPVRVSAGQKQWCPVRQIWTDPKAATLTPVFAGLGKGWQPDRTTVAIDLLDATYWLTTAMPVQIYRGTGKLDGDNNVVGRAMPRVRGSVRNITPTLIDSVNYVYQVSDGPAQISALYEGGHTGIAFDSFVTDIYATPPAPGSYTVQTGTNGTWLRLGTKPVYSITADVLGQFPTGASPVNVLDILRQFLLEDLLLPAAYIDPAWGPTSMLAPWPGGWFWDGSSNITGKQAATDLLSGLGITLTPTRGGTLLPMLLLSPDKGAEVAAELTPDVITAIAADSLDSSLDPPTWRWRIGFQHNFTVQAAGASLSPQITPVQQSFVAVADRAAVWYSADIKAHWRMPNDPDVISTALARQDDAALIAKRHGALWGTRRKLWAVSLPQSYGYLFELGDFVGLQADAPGLQQRVVGVVVGEQIRATDQTVTLQILV